MWTKKGPSRLLLRRRVQPHLRPLEPKDENKPEGVILSRAEAIQDGRGWQLGTTKGRLTFLPSPTKFRMKRFALKRKKGFLRWGGGIT